MAPAALGFRDHSGWAVMVGVAGDPRAPEVVLRERVELLDDAELPAQVYHEAAGRDLAEAAELIAIVERSARRAAATVLERAVGDLAGHEIVGVGLGLDRGRLPDDLAKILSNHTSLHVGEGELYREALADAAASQGLKTTRHDFKSLAEIAEARHRHRRPPGGDPHPHRPTLGQGPQGRRPGRLADPRGRLKPPPTRHPTRP